MSVNLAGTPAIPSISLFNSVSRTPQRERMFDGVAGDPAEALSSLHAHVRYLASDGGTTARE
jgi:hypothetical protein